MKSTPVLSLILASMALAQPHGKHVAHQQAHKRGAVVTEWVTEYLTETVTVFIDGESTSIVYPEHTATTPAAVAAVTTDNAGQFFEGAATTMTTPPIAAPPPPPPAEVVPPVSQAGASDASHVDGDQHQGELTFYDVGLGACGEDDSGKGETDNIVALSHLLMGEQSNGNPNCFKTITVSYGGKSAVATVKDKCMGCATNDIDGSRHLFKEFASEDAGRLEGVEWWFN